MRQSLSDTCLARRIDTVVNERDCDIGRLHVGLIDELWRPVSLGDRPLWGWWLPPSTSRPASSSAAVVPRRIPVATAPAVAFRDSAARFPASRSGGCPTLFAKMARGPKKHMKRLAAPSHWVRGRSCATARSRRRAERDAVWWWGSGHLLFSSCCVSSGGQSCLLAGSGGGGKETGVGRVCPLRPVGAASWLQHLTRYLLWMVCVVPPISNRATLTDAR